jgi:hypothetical protein
MVKCHLPSIEALTANDDDLLTEELRLSTVCQELAVARAFLDHVERLVSRRAVERAPNDASRIAAARPLSP